MLILISGLPGSGKSYFGEKLAAAIGAIYLNSDKVRVQMCASGKYSIEDKLSVYRQMTDEASQALDAGKDAVVDATFYRQPFREPFERLAATHGTSLYVIEVKADEPTIMKRLSSPREFSEADYKVYEKLRDEFEEITVPHLVLRSTDSNLAEMLRTAVEYIRGMTQHDVDELARGVTFEGRPYIGQVEETHISWVVLTPAYAFKIKKKLKLSFLDFSTLAMRKFYCEKELELNRRFTDIYLSVQPITKSGNTWFIGSREDSQVVDYCVVMKRLNSDRRMDLALTNEVINPELIRTLADRVAVFHKNAKPIFTPFDMVTAKDTFNDILSVGEFISSTLGDHFSDILSQSVAWSNEFLASHVRRFQSRIDEGFRRDVHGDLHAGNIFLYPEPVIFDCIEFNDQFRQIDVLYEVAYLCMDLESNHHRQYAAEFFRRYAEQFPVCHSAEDHVIFDYFKALRANVRAKVHAIAAKGEEDPADVLKHITEVKKYLTLLREYISRRTA